VIGDGLHHSPLPLFDKEIHAGNRSTAISELGDNYILACERNF
jgi:hypothetical protein